MPSSKANRALKQPEHTIIEVSYFGVRVENDETGVRAFSPYIGSR